jgi:uncharacterized protein YcbK (DUF882 family)
MTINWKDNDQKVSKYFTVGEVTQDDDRRIPTDPIVIKNILKLATELDKVRGAWGSPIRVSSWYRPKQVNREVGGAYGSKHILGYAADILPVNGSVIEFEKWLDARWNDGLGYGARKKGFVHVDLRHQRGFLDNGETKQKSDRWNY